MLNILRIFVSSSLISLSMLAMDAPPSEAAMSNYIKHNKQAISLQWSALVGEDRKIQELNVRMGGLAHFKGEVLLELLQREIKKAIENIHSSSLEVCMRERRFYVNGRFDENSFYPYVVHAEHEFFSVINMGKAAYDKRFYEFAWLVFSLAEEVFSDLSKEREITDSSIKAARAITQSYLGLMNKKGQGIKANEAEAVRHLLVAAKTLHEYKEGLPYSSLAPNKMISFLMPIGGEAAYELASMYQHGQGVEINLFEVMKYLDIAENYNHKEAIKKLNSIKNKSLQNERFGIGNFSFIYFVTEQEKKLSSENMYKVANLFLSMDKERPHKKIELYYTWLTKAADTGSLDATRDREQLVQRALYSHGAVYDEYHRFKSLMEKTVNN